VSSARGAGGQRQSAGGLVPYSVAGLHMEPVSYRVNEADPRGPLRVAITALLAGLA
jgi:hypothetical protein